MPTIGMITYRTDNMDDKSADSFIIDSHIKWMRKLGIKVLPIPYDTHDRESYMCQLDGLYLPSSYIGNGSNRTKHDTISCIMWFMNQAIQLNKAGIYFPVFGVCMGMQYLLMVQSGVDELMEEFDSFNNYELPFNLSKGSRIMQGLSPREDNTLRGTLALHNHSRGLSPEKFKRYKALTNFYNITAIDKDRAGKEFISSIEGKKYPFYGFQWHPEHSKHAVKLFGRFIRNELAKHTSKKCVSNTRKMKRTHRKTVKNGMDVSAFYYKSGNLRF